MQSDKRSSIRRKRIASEIRLQIVDAVMDGRCNGAEAARTFSVSEATVHRLVKAERIANPGRIIVAHNRAASRNENQHVSNKADFEEIHQGRKVLTISQQQEVIEKFYSDSIMPTDIARNFGVHKSTISRILRAARSQFPLRQLPDLNQVERQRRVNEGVTRARASGRHPGPRSKLSTEMQQAIIFEVRETNKSFISVAKKYAISPSMVSRIIREHRNKQQPINPLSLEEMLADLMK